MEPHRDTIINSALNITNNEISPSLWNKVDWRFTINEPFKQILRWRMPLDTICSTIEDENYV